MEQHVTPYGDYMPHGMCLLWEPWLLVLWAGSDFLIFLSYTAIPIALFKVLRKRTEVPEPTLVMLFAAFILLCGITHFFMIVTLWVPIYPIVGWVKLATGLVSTATAIMLFRLIPQIVRLPSPAALENANRGLQAEIAAHQQTLASLDQQVRERTAELAEATAALAVQAREAVHRSSNLLAIVQTLAHQTAKDASTTNEFLKPFLGRVRALADATRSIANSDRSSASISEIIETGLAVASETYGTRIRWSGPPLAVNPTAAQQLSLAMHELATNTLKYGLGAAEDVNVSLTWTIDTDDVFELVWREERGDLFEDQSLASDGFGTMLLTNIVPATLGGTAERSMSQKGMVYRLRVPLAAVTAPERAGQDTDLAACILDATFKA